MGTEGGCEHEDCGASSNVMEHLSFGRGDLDYNGFWEIPCDVCARAYELRHPEYAPAWPYSQEYLDKMNEEMQGMK